MGSALYWSHSGRGLEGGVGALVRAPNGPGERGSEGAPFCLQDSVLKQAEHEPNWVQIGSFADVRRSAQAFLLQGAMAAPAIDNLSIWKTPQTPPRPSDLQPGSVLVRLVWEVLKKGYGRQQRGFSKKRGGCRDVSGDG